MDIPLIHQFKEVINSNFSKGDLRSPVFINCVHGHELKEHQVEDSCNDGEAEEDEEESEEDVEGVGLQGLILLEGHQVTKAWSKTQQPMMEEATDSLLMMA